MTTVNTSRDLNSLLQVSINRLNSTTLAGSGSTPGSFTRLLLAEVNSISKDFYDTLTLAMTQAFLSTASDNFLDQIGALLNCKRNTNEDDDNYRYRISQQTATIASANRVAIRLAALSVDGVLDAVLLPYTYGTGSGSVYVTTQDPYPTSDFLNSVQSAIDDVSAFGNRITVLVPAPITSDIGIKLIFNKKVADIDQNGLMSQAQTALNNYITGLMPGDSIVIDQLIGLMMNVSKDIYDVQFYKFLVNSKPALLVNQTSNWNERFVPGFAPDALIVS